MTGVNIDEKDTGAFVTLMDIIVESVAWNVLPVNVFHKLFRGDVGVASLWRRFLLAQRLHMCSRSQQLLTGVSSVYGLS